MTEKQFIQLIDQHQQIIHKICLLYRDTKEDREDLFQEIVFQLWKSITSFRNESQFSTWMYRVALSTAVAAFRKKEPKIVFGSPLPDVGELNADNYQRSQLLYALKQLSTADRALIALSLEGFTYLEIAQITGLTETNVGAKLTRIKKKLQELTKLI